jgi:hypothetical protein
MEPPTAIAVLNGLKPPPTNCRTIDSLRSVSDHADLSPRADIDGVTMVSRQLSERFVEAAGKQRDKLPGMKILSAGQTSTERAAMAVAGELRIPRDQSADAADGILALTHSRPPRWKGPIMQIIDHHCDTPSLVVAVRWPQLVWATREWIRRKRIRRLCIIGHAPYRESREFLRLVLDRKIQVPKPVAKRGFKGLKGPVRPQDIKCMSMEFGVVHE